MECNDDGRGGAEHDVKIEPVAGISLAAQPPPALPQRVQVNEKEEQHAKHAEFDPNCSARPKKVMFWRKRPVQCAKRVIVVAIAGNDNNDGKGEKPRETYAKSMALLGVFASQYGGICSCGYAHCFAICSLVFTENRLYPENWWVLCQ